MNDTLNIPLDIHSPIKTSFDRVHKGYCLYEHGVIHFSKAETLYDTRGWVRKNQRCATKKLCADTYLGFDAENFSYFIKYQGTKIISILPNYQWILHPPSYCWGQLGLGFRLNTFLPANIYLYQGSLYAGSKDRRVTADLAVNLHDEFRHRNQWHGAENYSYSYGQGHQRPSAAYAVKREYFSRLLNSYLYQYFSTYSDTSWRSFSTSKTLKLALVAQEHSGFDMTDRLLLDKEKNICKLDAHGNWLHATTTTNPSTSSGSAVTMQALAYLFKYSFVPPSPKDWETNDPWKFPKFLEDWSGQSKFIAGGSPYGYWNRNKFAAQYKPHYSLFMSSRSALAHICSLFKSGSHSSYFAQRRSDLNTTASDNPSHTQRRYNNHTNRGLTTFSIRDAIRMLPYTHNEDDEDQYEGDNAKNSWGALKYIHANKWSGSINAYYPRILLVAIMDYYKDKGILDSAYIDYLCTSCFDGSTKQHQRKNILPDTDNTPIIGLPITPDNPEAALISSRFAPVYTLLYNFFMDRFPYIVPAISVSEDAPVEDRWFRENSTTTKCPAEGLIRRPLRADIADVFLTAEADSARRSR
jgi:hypothetical protein